MGLMKLDTNVQQDLALEIIKELVGEKTRTKGMRKFLSLVHEGKININIKKINGQN